MTGGARGHRGQAWIQEAWFRLILAPILPPVPIETQLSPLGPEEQDVCVHARCAVLILGSL